jgi:hypothetical protein
MYTGWHQRWSGGSRMLAAGTGGGLESICRSFTRAFELCVWSWSGSPEIVPVYEKFPSNMFSCINMSWSSVVNSELNDSQSCLKGMDRQNQ